ncbi:DUF599 domain-containing protein [Aestuariirhabdus litorea]|uniref:DUF599 family protein n=1 Tax=Aestuariirhabdus litorea TaxID=2528527 RepID=A0A3P3VSK3_9GAMM|nr:DUF599 domain-containing protein [Aestuariirhabdus litorea]RRJ84948.1 DUF599 family protein [Aestuariirhabdus litorea]RWW98173.1 DUF599 family protein [Endozoicomonadaceae bacterium GTF-13]
MQAYLLDGIAVAWLFTVWVGYTLIANYLAKGNPCLASVLHLYRGDWMRSLLKRENRIADTAIIANLERNVSFFASTSILVLAGLLTLLSTPASGMLLLSDLPFAELTSRQLWEVKILVMIVIFVYAFFTFTWSLRVYNFASVLMGSAPLHDEELAEAERGAYAQRLANVLSIAAAHFNYGLRAYYFGLATLSWVVSPWLLIGATALVVFILYYREFHSRVLKEMMLSEPGQ